MKLLLITSSFARTRDEAHNAGGFVRDVAIGLAEAGHDVTVLTPQRNVVADGFTVETIPWLGTEGSLSHVDPSGWRAKVELASVLISGTVHATVFGLRRRPDRVVAFWALPAGLMATVSGLFTRRPFDVWALGSDVWRVDDYPLGRPLLRRVLRRADRRFADGSELVAEVEAIAQQPCHFLPSSRRLPAAHPVDNRPSDRFTILTVARFHAHKGLDVLVDAIDRLPADLRQSVSVDIWGGGPEKDALSSQIERLGLDGIITLRGFISAQAFADQATAADLCVVPSRLESIPVILSDLAQLDAAMIVTDTGDVGELVQRHDAGRVVPVDDAAALAEAIGHAMTTSLPGTPAGRRALAAELGLERSVATLADPSVARDRTLA